MCRSWSPEGPLNSLRYKVSIICKCNASDSDIEDSNSKLPKSFQQHQRKGSIKEFWLTTLFLYGAGHQGWIKLDLSYLQQICSFCHRTSYISCKSTKDSWIISLLLPGEMNILQIQCKIEFNTFLLRKTHSRCIKWLRTMLVVHVGWLLGISGHHWWFLVLTGNIWWLWITFVVLFTTLSLNNAIFCVIFCYL